MHHLGDITKIDGHKVPITDVVIGGSPCQDLSVAGKRAGLDGERSGLFMEQIRVIKEMRDEDRRNGRTDVFVRPRYMVWENVPGALSSGQPKGEDFRIVLEETARVADPNASIPRPKDGKWTTSGCILGDGWSIAWRILDLQFWGATYFDDEGVPTKLGTPQRRRRIALVADFNGGSAGQILFESNSSVGDFAESGNEGQGTPGDTEESIAESGISFQERAGKPGGGKGILTQVGHTGAIVSGNTQNVVQAYGISAYESNSMKSSNPHSGVYEADTTRTLDNNGGNPSCNQGGMAVVSFEPGAAQRLNTEGRYTEEVAPTLRANMGDNQAAVAYGVSSYNQDAWEDVSPSLRAASGGDTKPMVMAEAPTHTHTHTPHSLNQASQNGKRANRASQLGQAVDASVAAARPSLQKTVGTLCADDWRGANSQYVGDGKLIVEDAESNRNA